MAPGWTSEAVDWPKRDLSCNAQAQRRTCLNAAMDGADVRSTTSALAGIATSPRAIGLRHQSASRRLHAVRATHRRAARHVWVRLGRPRRLQEECTVDIHVSGLQRDGRLSSLVRDGQPPPKVTNEAPAAGLSGRLGLSVHPLRVWRNW
jgi:hypothetical protein